MHLCRTPRNAGLAAALCLVCCAGEARADAAADPFDLSLEQLLDATVTSVTKTSGKLRDAPAAVYVITEEDIRRSGAPNLPEVLRLAPNLEVARMNGLGYTITARGFNSPESSNKLQVLIDGRSVYSPLASSVFWENVSLPLADIARIEVISGPGGTLYGANAVNGVINIVTKNSAETKGWLLSAAAGTTDNKAMLRYGSELWQDANVRVYGRIERANDTTPVNPADPIRSAWRQEQGGFRFDQNGKRDTFMLEGDIFASETPELPLERARGYDLTGQWTHGFESGSSLAMAMSADENVRTLPGLSREQLATLDLQLQHNTSLWWNDAFVWGGEYRRWKESFYSGAIILFAEPTTTITLGSGFVQDQFAILDDLKITLGIKAENNSYSGFDYLPNFRLAWQASATDLFWAAVSRAERDPSKIDRELESPGLLLPSPNFRPETLTAYELGYRGELLTRTSLSVSTFYNVYNDIRTDHYTPVTIVPVILRNGIVGDNYGAELWGTYALRDWWRLSAGVSLLQRALHLKPGRNDLSAGQSIGQDPGYQAQLRSQMNLFDKWEFDTALRAVGHVTQRNPLGGQTVLVAEYFEMDARLGWHVSNGTELSLGGFNLLHQRHLEANDPSTYSPQYVPRSFQIILHQSL